MDPSLIILLDGLQEPELSWRAGGGGTLGRSTHQYHPLSTLYNHLHPGLGAVAAGAEVHTVFFPPWKSFKRPVVPFEMLTLTPREEEEEAILGERGVRH